MVFPKEFGVWLMAAASLSVVASGCSTMSKNASAKASKASAQAQAASVATPGSAEFSSGSELKNPVKVHLAYALWHEQEGNYVEARNSYNKVLEKSSKNVDALLGLSRLDMRLNRMADAEARLLKAQKIAPKNPEVALALGQYHATLQNWPRALEYMKTARSLSPYEPVYAYQLGVTEAKSGDLSAALTSFTEAVGAPEAHYNLGVILHDQGQLVAAEEHLRKAVTQKPELAQAQKLLANVRQERSNGKTNVARNATQEESHGEETSPIQPAGYTQPAPR